MHTERRCQHFLMKGTKLIPLQNCFLPQWLELIQTVKLPAIRPEKYDLNYKHESFLVDLQAMQAVSSARVYVSLVRIEASIG